MIGPWRNTWTQVVGGMLTIAIRVLLVSREISCLGGLLGATDQAKIEGPVMSATHGVPDWIVMVVFAILVAAWSATALLQRRQRPASGDAAR